MVARAAASARTVTCTPMTFKARSGLNDRWRQDRHRSRISDCAPVGPSGCSSVASPKCCSHRGRRCARRARREEGGPGVCNRRATPRPGMQRRPNVTDFGDATLARRSCATSFLRFARPHWCTRPPGIRTRLRPLRSRRSRRRSRAHRLRLPARRLGVHSQESRTRGLSWTLECGAAGRRTDSRRIPRGR
jgi:hypothetical protein